MRKERERDLVKITDCEIGKGGQGVLLQRRGTRRRKAQPLKSRAKKAEKIASFSFFRELNRHPSSKQTDMGKKGAER